MEVQSLGCFWQPSPQKTKQICILHSTTTHTYVRLSFKNSSPNCSIPTLASSSLLFPSVTLSLSALTPLPISPPFVMRQERLSSQAPPLYPVLWNSFFPVSLTALLSSSRLFSSVTLSSSSCSLWIFSSVLILSTCQESWELFRLFITVDKHAEKQMEFVLQMVQKA